MRLQLSWFDRMVAGTHSKYYTRNINTTSRDQNRQNDKGRTLGIDTEIDTHKRRVVHRWCNTKLGSVHRTHTPCSTALIMYHRQAKSSMQGAYENTVLYV